MINKIKELLPFACFVAMVVLAVGNLVYEFQQREKRHDALVAQGEAQMQAIEQGQREKAAEEAKLAAEAQARFDEIVARPVPKPTPAPIPEQPPAPPKENGKVTDKDGNTAEKQPDYIKPSPPPKPTPTPEKPKEPAKLTPKPKPSEPKDGTERTNADGVLEIYIGGFGWITSGGPNETIQINNDGWEDSPQIGF